MMSFILTDDRQKVFWRETNNRHKIMSTKDRGDNNATTLYDCIISLTWENLRTREGAIIVPRSVKVTAAINTRAMVL